jgi:hypothetical protein
MSYIVKQLVPGSRYRSCEQEGIKVNIRNGDMDDKLDPDACLDPHHEQEQASVVD